MTYYTSIDKYLYIRIYFLSIFRYISILKYDFYVSINNYIIYIIIFGCNNIIDQLYNFLRNVIYYYTAAISNVNQVFNRR